MHDIEPFFKWREKYIASEDERSPFHGKVYNEFTFSTKIYNYYIHPQWDEMGSPTLYLKILFVDYSQAVAVIELIGEWNDAINNDIMFLKREIADTLIQEGIHKFILIAENVLNFHGSDDCYYEEWFEDIVEENGWIVMLNLLPHVMEEMQETRLHHYVNLGDHINEIEWRRLSPLNLLLAVESKKDQQIKSLG